jgi:hypothetical protein
MEEIGPLPPFECPNTLAIIRNKFFSPPEGRNFLLGGRVDPIWDPLNY